ncbi:MAG: His-Xaa-Ser system protein HxsD [Prevotellaceae bacterium]|nr:His-Xaa-Ser system protein HxsD [Candidatus Faecinaster equi]
MKLAIDRKIYDDAAISKTIYWLSGKYTFQRHLEGDTETISISLKPEVSTRDIDIECEFMDTLNDYKVRGIIETETHDVRTILYAKAFADDIELSEEDLSE